jgi:hypothetical protein
MRRDTSFAGAALLTLAVGIGATIAVFSIVYGVLLRPLPYPEPDRLVRLYEEHPGAPKPPGEPPLSNTVMYAWRDRTNALEGLSAYYGREYTVMFDGGARRIHGAKASRSGGRVPHPGAARRGYRSVDRASQRLERGKDIRDLRVPS